MDRKWMQANRLSQEYEKGVKEFISFAVRHSQDKRFIKCPCWKCMNILEVEVNDVELYKHLIMNGIDKTYTCWTNHGETKDSLNNHGLKNTGNMNTIKGNKTKYPNVEMHEGSSNDDDKPLWKGCKFSKSYAVSSLLELQKAHQLSDQCINELFSVLSDMLPAGNVLPRSIPLD